MNHTREILIVDDEAGHAGHVVTREPLPSTDLSGWRGCGPARGEWEAGRPGNDAEGVGLARRVA
jgi:hypothetical protein